jgi:GcrA cell cycle regulator
MARRMCGYHYGTARRAWQRGEAELPPKAKVPEKRIRWSEADLQDVARRLTIESVATVAESYGIKAPGLCGLLKRHGLSAREIRKQHKSGPVSNAGLGLPGSSGVFVGHAAAAVAALAVGQCRWPDGDPREAGFRFCSGAKVAGKPYCAEHMAGAFSGFGRGFPGIATTLAKV